MTNLRLEGFLKSGKKVDLGNLFDYLQGIVEGLGSIVRWEAREKIGGQSVRENDLQHTFKTVFLTVMCAVNENEHRAESDKLDIGLLAIMALIHDIAEIVVGDMPSFVKIGKNREPEMKEFVAFQEIINPLPEKLREYFIQAFRRVVKKAPVFINDKESRFFNAIENVGYLKRALYECRLGNLHFAPKCLDRQIAVLQDYSREFPSLRVLYEPHIDEVNNYLEKFQKQKDKYITEFVRRGRKEKDFPF